MELRNTESQYGAVAMLLHWLIAFLIIGLIIMGLYMESLPDVGFNSNKIILILLHKQLGIMTLSLVIVRIVWRFINMSPRLAETIPEWQQNSAHLMHFILYLFMFALPISGWLMTSAAGIPVSLLGLFDLPNLVPINEYQMQFYILVHSYLAYVLIFFILAHATAALTHHFFDKDDTLKKMLP